MNLGFYATVAVLVVGAALTVALVFRLLMRWTTPEADRPPLGRHATVVAVLAVVAFIGVQGGTAIADAMREPSAWQEQNRQASEQRRQDEDATCSLVVVGDFTGAHQAAVDSGQNLVDLVRPLADLAAYRAGDDLRLVMNASEHVNVRCRNTTWREIAALFDPPIPQEDLDAAATSVAADLAEVCAAAGGAQFGVAQRILNEAVVLPGLTETLGALHDRIARSGESRIIEGWIDGIRENWCPDLPATEGLLAQWAATHRSLHGRFMIAPTRRDGDPCVEMRQRGILGGDLTIYAPDGVVGVGRFTHGDGVGPLDDLRCWVSPDSRIPVEIADTYRLVAGGIELATFTDTEVVASGGEFDVPVTLEPVDPSTPSLLRPHSIAGASVSTSGRPLRDLEAVLGTHHSPQAVGAIGPPEVFEWSQHGISVSLSQQSQPYPQMDGWEYRGGPSMEFATEEGITVGSSFNNLDSTYGTRLLWSQPRPVCGEGWIFVIGDARFGRIEGLLDGPPDPSSTVLRLWSGEALRCSETIPSTVAVATTTSTTTTRPTTTATTTTVPLPIAGSDAVALLSAHANGIDLRFGTDIVTVLEGTPVSAAFADGLGGVVYQREIPGDRPMWDWGPDLTEPVLVWHDGGPLERPIMWMPSLGSQPLVLVPYDDESWIELVDVTTLGTRRVVIYEREVSLVDSCVGLDDLTHCYFESLRTRLTARDLETGQEWSLGRSGSFEWGAQASIAGSRAAVNLSNADHGEPAAIVLVDVSAMLALDRDAGITSVTSDGMTTIALAGPCEGSSYCDDDAGNAALSVSAISRDGSSLAFLEYYHSCCGRSPNDTELVIWDLEQGREKLRIHLGQNQWATWIDHNGADTLLGLYPNNSILVDADGVTIALPAGPRYSFWDQ